MPGNIQVTVLELVDLPSPPPLSSLSLKVFMGKREYYNAGGGELSFPMMSLRENLIVVLYDAAEEILRTEVITRLLIEKGFWDTFFPLKDGGSLHMKLQFSLTAEDRKRIHEMRDSALKNRRIKKSMTKHRRSLSDNRIGNTVTKTISESVTDEILLGHSELTNPGVGPYLGQREKFLATGIATGGSPRSALAGERPTGNLKFAQIMSKSFSSGMLSQVSSEEKFKLVEPFFLKKNCEAQNVIPTINYRVLVNKDLEIDKSICKLKIGFEEIKFSKSTSSHTDPPYSAPSNSYMTIDNVDKTVDTGRSTILVVSAGTSGVRKDFATDNVEKGSSTRPTLLNRKAVGEMEKLNIMHKEGGSFDINEASGIFLSRYPSHSAELRAPRVDISTVGKHSDSIDMRGDRNTNFSGGVNRKREVLDVNKNKNEQVGLRGKSFPLHSIFDGSEMIEHPYQCSSLVEVARRGSDESTSQNSSNKWDASDEPSNAGNKHNSRNNSGDGNASSSEEVDRRTRTLGANESNDEERSLRDNSLTLDKLLDDSEKFELPYQHGSSVEVARTVNDNIMSLIPSYEPAFPGSSYEKAGQLNYCYSSVCHIGLLGTWTPRHLCITTGNNLLRDFAESFTVSVETGLIENSSTREADAKILKTIPICSSLGHQVPSSQVWI
ncbi:hypothetical protein KSP39_PZI019903 [Platanthera zijinensis]|uniref:Uncharacterized protein n=1 Tax=Platanthera zijinensis TaxID=2320716 RepID=A0AAP0AZ91_9ASPA